MGPDLLDSLADDVLDAGRQSGDAENVGSAPFEEVRELARLRFAGRVAAGASFTPDADFGARPHIESAGAGGAQQRLVPGESEQIDEGRLDVERNRPRG